MTLCCMPAAVFGDGEVQTDIYVNGEKISDKPNHTVQCGTGTAIYSPDDKTLTLHGANITENYKADKGVQNGGIYVSSGDLNLKLIGENHITFTDTGEWGVYVSGSLHITAEEQGSLIVDTVDNCIYSNESLTISSGTIETKNTNTPGYSAITAFESLIIDGDAVVDAESAAGTAIVVNYLNESTPAEVKIGGNAKVTAKAAGTSACGISCFGYLTIGENAVVDARSDTGQTIATFGSTPSQIIISGGKVDAVSTNSTAIYTKGSLAISGTADVTAKGKQRGLQGKNIVISGGEVNAESTDSIAIWTPNMLTISGTADAMAKGRISGLQSENDFTVSGGNVNAESAVSIAIWTPKALTISGGNIHSKSTGGNGAIGARVVKTGDEEPSEHIALSNGMTEMNGGKIAVSDWFEVTLSNGTKQNRCWTSFIAKGESQLKVENGLMANALNEVRISIPAPVPSDPLAYDRYKAVQELEKYVDKQNYDADGQQEIDEIVGAAKKSVYGASSKENIDQALAEAKAKLDQVLTIEEKEEAARLERIKEGVAETTIRAWSIGGKGQIKVRWKKSFGFKVDCFEVFRSAKKNSGYGKKPFFTTKEGTKCYYINTRQLKKGTRYFYKIRGVRTIGGETYYTRWSNKAIRIAK